eukprot:TRINITY_DN773136_c0_g1_i1.p1 TRINITY_DN773136_c0_g1~~TRINITY_DN773136_c0_g1_i1.p1  ORF type:complete len:170 (-),score=23.89 TRINITY_DN773136_c0_g1_i1:477-986(-)
MEPFLVVKGVEYAGASLLGATASKTSSYVSGLLSSCSHGDLYKELSELDLETHLAIIENLANEIPENHNSKCVKLCLESVKSSVETIHKYLQDVEIQEREYQNSSWFGKWWKGAPNFAPTLKELVRHNNILHTRFEMMIKILDLRICRDAPPSKKSAIGLQITTTDESE